MTRINLVKPSELSDQHLVAEYREIFMVGSALQRSIKSKNWKRTKEQLPKDFTLNVGHVKFFYNKGKYLNRNKKIAKKIMQFNLIRKNNFDKPLGPLFIKKTIKDNPIHPLYCSDNSILQSYF